jgi:type II secretory ATPase GspE/PulE/Tfp pilus assembly ATPase PilB-like protein
MSLIKRILRRSGDSASAQGGQQDAFAEMRRLMKEHNRRSPLDGPGEGPAASAADDRAHDAAHTHSMPRPGGSGGGRARDIPSEALVARPLASIAVPDDVVPERFARELPLEFKNGIPDEAIALVKPSTARANQILPYRFDAREKTLHIAIQEPPGTDRRQALDYTLNASARGLTLEFTPIPKEFQEHLTRLIDNYYPPFARTAHGAGGSKPDGADGPTVATRYGFSQTLEIDARELQARAAGTPLDFVDYLLNKATTLGASDVMIDRHGPHTRIKVMIDGRGYLFDEPMEGDVCEKSIRVLKNFCDMPTTRVRKPKGASFKSKLWINGQLRRVRFRAEFSPAGETEAVTVRIHAGNEYLVDLDSLTIDERSRQTLAGIQDADQGLYAVTGRVGEGKSTTLHAVVLRHDRVETPFASLQDPIEFEIEDVRGLDIREFGLTYADGLKSVLRWGMSKVLLGEIRDAEVGRIALEAAKGGHLILTTFHAPDSVAAISRLTGNPLTKDEGLGWTPGDIADTVPALFAQRLLPKLCNVCREPVTYREEDLITAGFDATMALDGRFYRPGRDRCAGCRNGFAGRVLVIETLRLNNLIREILYENRHDTLQRDVRRAAIEDGLIPLRESALGAVARGDVWLDDALRKTQWHEGDLAVRTQKRVYKRHVEMIGRDRALGAGPGLGEGRLLAAADPATTEEDTRDDTEEMMGAVDAPADDITRGPSSESGDTGLFGEEFGMTLPECCDEPGSQSPRCATAGAFVLELDDEEPADTSDDDRAATFFCAAD